MVALVSGAATTAAAQEPDATTREAAIEKDQAEKAKDLHPYVPNRFEALLAKAEIVLAGGYRAGIRSSNNVYSGGGFTLGVGFAQRVSPYNWFDVRGSYTITGNKRAEAEFNAPRLFHRRGFMSLLGGWREATQVGFYGIGTDTSIDNRTNYSFQQPVRRGNPHVLANTTSTDVAWWPGAVRAGAAARRGHAAWLRLLTRLRPFPALARKYRMSIPRAPSGSTGAPRPAIRDAGVLTGSRCTTTPTETKSSASRKSTTK